jgi:hypothetical protein
MPKNTQPEGPEKTSGGSVFSFSDLDSAWPNYKDYPIFKQGQNKELKFVLQCN